MDYEVTFTVVVSLAESRESAVLEARQLISDTRFEPVSVKGLVTDLIKQRLEYLRGELRAERISMSELLELQGLAGHIDSSDVELLEAAGVPEFPEEA